MQQSITKKNSNERINVFSSYMNAGNQMINEPLMIQTRQ